MSLFQRPIVLLLLAASFVSSAAFSQPIQPRLRWQEGDPIVKALLVRIWTYEGRINLLKGSGDENSEYLSEELKKDVKNVSELARKDWSSHYTFTPVYFFVDTAVDKVIEKRFNGVLLDKDLKPVSDPVLKDGDTAFFIASSDPWLTVYDHNLVPLPPRLPANHRNDGAFLIAYSDKYKYRSKAFRFGYRGVARNYHKTISAFYSTYKPAGPAAE